MAEGPRQYLKEMASRDIQKIVSGVNSIKAAATPKNKRLSTLTPFTPTTAHRNIDALLAEREEFLEFRKYELECATLCNDSGQSEDAALVQSLADSNLLLADCRRLLATSQDEVATLKSELQQCRDCQTEQKRNYDLQIFRLQQDLDRRNTEIFRLRKDKEDFDYKLKMAESKKDRSIEELTQALMQSRVNSDSDATISLLKSQLEEVKLELENAQSLLRLQMERADRLSEAYDESNSEWKIIGQEFQHILDEYQTTTTDPITIDSNPTAPELHVLDLLSSLFQPVQDLDTADLQTAAASPAENESEMLQIELSGPVNRIVKPLFDLLNENVEESKTAYEVFDKETRLLFEATSTDVLTFLEQHKIPQNTEVLEKAAHEMNTSTTDLTDGSTSELAAIKVEKSALNERIKEMDEEQNSLKQAQVVLESKIQKLTGENDAMEKELATARASLSELQKSKVIKAEAVDVMLDGGCTEQTQQMVKNESLQCSGMTTFLSAAEEPSNIGDVSQAVTNTTSGVVVDTVYTLPREHTRSLDEFAREFYEYLMENQIFHPEDNPPTDSSVFYFVLDRYLLLVDTYYKARTMFEETLHELEEQDAKVNMKKELLLSQISQLNLTDTTCDSSVDVSNDMRSSTLCEGVTNASLADDTLCMSVVAEATHDPLEFTINNSIMNTPTVGRASLTHSKQQTPATRRSSINSSRIPKKATPAASKSAVRSKGMTTPVSRQSTTLCATPELRMTPVQRVLRRDPCSTAKKSVTFRSPLLARTAVEADNDRLKELVEEKQATINSLQSSMDNRLKTISQLEEQITHLEDCIAENRDLLERTENELTDRREQLEKELENVKTTLHTVTNKLLVEAINLDSSLEQRLRSEAPVKILTILLETIIKRFEKAQHTERMDFEKEREEWSTEMEKVATESQKHQKSVSALTKQVAELQKTVEGIQQHSKSLEERLSTLQEEKEVAERNSQQQVKDFEMKSAGKDLELSCMEQQIQSLKAEVADLEKKMADLVSEKASLEKLKEESSVSSGEVESLKLALENSDREKDRLQGEVEKLAEIQNEMELLKSQTAEKETRITELLQSVDGISAEKKVLEDEISGASEVFRNVSKFFSEELSGNLAEKLEAAYEIIEERIDQLTDKKDDQTSLITELKFNIEHVTSLKESLEKLIESKEADLQSLTEELSTMKTQFENKTLDLSKESEVFKESLSAKEVVLEELTARVRELEEQIGALKDEKSSVVEAKETNAAELKKAMEKETSLLLEKINELTSSVTKLEAEVANHVEEKEQLHLMLKECEARMSDLENSRFSLEQQLSEQEILTQEVESLKETVRAKTDAIAALENHLEVSSNEKAELSQKIESLLTEVVSVHELTASLSEVLVELAQKETTIADLIAEKTSIDEQLKQHLAVAATYSIGVAALKAEVLALKVTIDLLMKEKVERESKMSAEELSVANLQEKLAAAQKEIEKYEEEKKAMEESLSSVVQNLAAAEEKLDAASSRNAEFDAELILLKAEVDSNKRVIEQLTVELEMLGLSKLELQNEKQTLTEELAAMTSTRDGFLAEKVCLEEKISTLTELKLVSENEKKELNLKMSELRSSNEEISKKFDEVALSLESAKAEQSKEVDYWKGLKETCEQLSKACEVEKSNLEAKNVELVTLNEQISSDNAGLSRRIVEMEESLEVVRVEKTELLKKVDEMQKSGSELKDEKDQLAAKVTVLLENNFELDAAKRALVQQMDEVKEILQGEKNYLAKKLEESEQRIAELLLQVEDFKSMEGAILRKLEEKQKSVENAFLLKSQLDEAEQKLSEMKASADAEIDALKADLKKKTDLIKTNENDLMTFTKEVRDLEQAVRGLEEDKEQLSKDLERKTAALNRKNQLMDDLMVKVKLLEGREVELNREHNLKVKKIAENNAELKALLNDVHKTLGLPQDAVLNLSADTDTRAYLRMIQDNVQHNESVMDGLLKNKLSLQTQQEKLTVQVEKLTSEKVHFEIQAAELKAFGETQQQQIDTLTDKLVRLEERLGRKSRGGNDVIGSRRMEKLEEMNRTLHELLTQLLTTMKMPNAAKLRLISQREVDSATSHILQHAAKLALALDQVENLKEQIKDLDKENQDLSDNVEALLKDNSKLELEILDLKKGQRGGADTVGSCKACNEFKNNLKKKSEIVVKLEAQVAELNDKIKELDKENQDLSDNVDALLKDNSKLEMELLEARQGVVKRAAAADCTACNRLKKTVTSQDDEIVQLKTKCEDNSQCISELKDQITKLSAKCADLEGHATDKEQQLHRALNWRMRGAGDEVRTSGMVREIDQGERIRSLTKEKEMMKELLRQRSTTIKSLKSQLKEAGIEGCRSPMEPLNTNRMDSPIRERLYNLRTRQETRRSRLSKPAIHVDIENIRV